MAPCRPLWPEWRRYTPFRLFYIAACVGSDNNFISLGEAARTVAAGRKDGFCFGLAEVFYYLCCVWAIDPVVKHVS